MNRLGHQQVTFFVGTEIEHTPVYGRKTLFVVGVQPLSQILEMAQKNDCAHIYFGANRSFDPRSAADWDQWEHLVRQCLDHGYWCTLDFDVSVAELVAETSLVEYNTFIPMISVKIPYVRQMNYNAVVKIDDKDFAATNPGVWCHRLHDLQSTNCFTDWSQYGNDEIVS